jgi:hypothetical protein
MSFYGCRAGGRGPLGDVDQATLTAWLAQALQAKADLMTGSKPVTIEVTGGGQHRSVTYAKTDLSSLNAWIMDIRQALGTGPRRSAIAVTF